MASIADLPKWHVCRDCEAEWREVPPGRCFLCGKFVKKGRLPIYSGRYLGEGVLISDLIGETADAA